MKIQNMVAFPVPISYGTLGKESRELNKLLIENIKEDLKVGQRHGSGNGVYQTFPPLEEKYPAFQTLKNAMDVASTQTLQFANVVGASADSYHYWGNYNSGNPSAYHIPHSHGVSQGAMFSGVYFPYGKEPTDEVPEILSTSKPAPGSLVMLDPIDFVKSAIATYKTERYPFFGLPLAIEPEEGAFVIFPAYLYHMVVPTANTNERISIAFEIRPRKE